MIERASPSRREGHDAVVVGGGFYGCVVAEHLRQRFSSVLLIESRQGLLEKASYNNQARVHQGYHYPRSILTSLRSRVNFQRFIRDYEPCIVRNFASYYALGRTLSKVNAAQFRLFCQRIGAPLGPAPASVEKLFNTDLIEGVFATQEYVFDANILRCLMSERLERAGVEVLLSTRATAVRRLETGLEVRCDGDHGPILRASYVFNCTYSAINRILDASKLPLLPLKHEMTELAVVHVPPALRGLSVTVMDGPFFSLMPFPPLSLYTLSHVRYTPHYEWHDRPGAPYRIQEAAKPTAAHCRFAHMLKDARRYLPCIGDVQYQHSLWEIKTVLPQSEVDDSRPILFHTSKEAPNLVSVMGGKIDNVFDVKERLEEMLATERSAR